MATHTRTLAAVVTGAVAAFGLVACGSDKDEKGFEDLSVEEIEKQVKADMAEVKSLRMAGELTSDGEKTGLDISVDTDGNCTGELSVGGASAQILQNKEGTFMKADETFWKGTAGESADQILALLGDKWAKIPTESAGFDEFCDLDNLLEEFTEDDDDDVKAEKGEVTELDGEEVLEITSEEDGATTTALITTEGKHYFVKVSQEGGDEPGEFTFSDFNKKVDAESPAKGQFVDIG